MYYPVKIPWLLKKIYPSLLWNMPAGDKNLYLTFDDGPHETATLFVLQQLKQFNAKASFFCIGKNVQAYPHVYQQILDEGHTVGNHTQNHLNGWKTDDKTYIENIYEAKKYIDSNLFRPPYGKITRFQMTLLQQNGKDEIQKTKNEKVSRFRHQPSPPHSIIPAGNMQHSTSGIKIIMWDILSGDFDVKLSPQKCLQNVLLNAKSGSIIVFHDSTKAWDRMNYALPKALEHFTKEGYSFKALSPQL